MRVYYLTEAGGWHRDLTTEEAFAVIATTDVWPLDRFVTRDKIIALTGTGYWEVMNRVSPAESGVRGDKPCAPPISSLLVPLHPEFS